MLAISIIGSVRCYVLHYIFYLLYYVLYLSVTFCIYFSINCVCKFLTCTMSCSIVNSFINIFLPSCHPFFNQLSFIRRNAQRSQLAQTQLWLNTIILHRVYKSSEMSHEVTNVKLILKNWSRKLSDNIRSLVLQCAIEQAGHKVSFLGSTNLWALGQRLCPWSLISGSSVLCSSIHTLICALP